MTVNPFILSILMYLSISSEPLLSTFVDKKILDSLLMLIPQITINNIDKSNKMTVQLYENNFHQLELKKQFKNVINSVSNYNLSELKIEEIMQKVAEQFIGSTYKADLLEIFTKEKLFVSIAQ